MRYNALTPGIGPPVAPATLFIPSLEGTGRGYYINPLAAEETLIDTGLARLGAVPVLAARRSNMLPKDGGNRFSGALFFAGTGGGLPDRQSHLQLQSQGLTSVNSVPQGVRRQRRAREPNPEGSSVSASSGRRAAGARRRVWRTCYADANISARTIGSSAAVVAVPRPQQPDLPGRKSNRGGGIRFTVRAAPEGPFHRSSSVRQRNRDQLTGQLETGTIKNEARRRDIVQTAGSVLPGPGPARNRRNSCSTPARPSAEFNFGGVRPQSCLPRATTQSAGGAGWSTTSRSTTQPRLHVQRHRQQKMALSHQTERPVQPLLRDRRHSVKTGVFWVYG